MDAAEREKIERQKVLADAIVLERAVKVLECRLGRNIPSAHTSWDTAVLSFLRCGARILRSDAEQGEGHRV